MSLPAPSTPQLSSAAPAAPCSLARCGAAAASCDAACSGPRALPPCGAASQRCWLDLRGGRVERSPCRAGRAAGRPPPAPRLPLKWSGVGAAGQAAAGLLAASSAVATPGGLGARFESTSQQLDGVCTRPVLQVLGTHPPTCGVPSTVRSVLVSGRPLKLNGLIPECIETVLSARTAPAASMPRHGVRFHERSAHCAEPFAARAEFQWWRKCASRHQQPWPRACKICLSPGELRVLLSSGTDVAAAGHPLLHCCMHLARMVECKRQNVQQAGRPGRT